MNAKKSRFCKLDAFVKGLKRESHQKKLMSNYKWSKQMKDWIKRVKKSKRICIQISLQIFK